MSCALDSAPAFCCCRRCWAGSPISKNCSPTAPIKGRSSPKRSPKSCLWSRSRSSNDPIRRKDSSRYPSAGSSSDRSLGSTAVEDWPRTGKTSTSQPSCSFVSRPSASCCEGSAIPHRLSSQTLTKQSVPLLLVAARLFGQAAAPYFVGCVGGWPTNVGWGEVALHPKNKWEVGMTRTIVRWGLAAILTAAAAIGGRPASAETVALVTINQQALFFNQINDGR